MRNYFCHTCIAAPCRLDLGLLEAVGLPVLASLVWVLGSPAWAQGTYFTYQGRMLDSGTNFTGLGEFKFALVTSTNANQTATATANAPSGGYINGYTITSGGNGYVTPPSVTIFGGGGAGAAAHANLSGGVVSSLTVDNAGNGAYTNAPTVLIAPPPASLSYRTYWSNDGTSVNGSEPAGAVGLKVTNGLFTVVLGDTTQPGMTAIAGSLFNQPNLQLRIWFNDGVQGFAPLDPAQALTPAPYALNLVGVVQNNVVQAGLYATVSGGVGNASTNQFATVGGGTNNLAGGVEATVAGGLGNTAANQEDTVAGGGNNLSSGPGASVGGGLGNKAIAKAATVAGGDSNTASAVDAAVGGGAGNTASGIQASVGGGYLNTASGDAACVPGGQQNMATQFGSFAAGLAAQSLHSGSFVWSDGYTFASTASSQFCVRADGGIRLAGNILFEGDGAYHHIELSGGNSLGYLYASYPALADGIHLGYNYYWDSSGAGHIINTGGGTSRVTVGYGEIVLALGGVNTHPTTVRLDATTTGVTVYGTFNNSSDRNAKQDFAPVNPAQILEQVEQLPISQWSYKEDAATRHIGPMGQDFYAAFNIGTDDKHIAPIDEGGVALAAIQGLSQKLNQKEAQIQQLEKELTELKAVVHQLTAERMKSLPNGLRPR